MIEIKPPLGKVLDLNRWEAEYLQSLPHVPLSRFRDLEQAARLAHYHSNNLRNKFGLEYLGFNPDDVRLIPHSIYSNDYACVEMGKDGAFYSPAAKKSFIRFNEGEDMSSKYGRIFLAYIIAHEEVHRSMEKSGVADYSHELNEGITEFITRDIMEGCVTRLFLSAEELRENQLCVRRMMPLRWKGQKLDEIDIIIYDPMVNQAEGYSRYQELHLIDDLVLRKSCTFDEMARYAFHGDSEGLKEYMEGHGIHFSDLVSKVLVVKEQGK